MKLQHPRARDDVPGKPPAKIDLGDITVDVDRDKGATFNASKAFGERLAARFDLELSDLEPGAGPDGSDDGESDTIAAAIEGGVCPWCDDYEGDSVPQHASSAHPDEWTNYKDGGS